MIRTDTIANKMPSYAEDRLYYNHLDARCQLLYDAMHRAISAGKDKTDTLQYQYSDAEYNTVVSFLLADNPSFFYWNAQGGSLQKGWNSSGVRLCYYFETHLIRDYTVRYEAAKKEILAQIGNQPSQTAYAEAIHDAMILHCTKTEQGGIYNTAYSALVQRVASGMGYAMAYCDLTRACGLNTYLVYGEQRGISLVWNMTEADGNITHTDVFSDDPDWKEPVLFHGFFSMSDEQVMESRQIKYYHVLPLSNANTSYYQRNHKEANTVSQMREILLEELRTAAQNKDRFIELRITFSSDIRLFEDVISEALRQMIANEPSFALHESFRIYSDADSNGAATIEIFYHENKSER